MFGFNVNKLKPNLKMAVHRIGIIKNKKSNVSINARREIAELLRDGKEEKARIKVEGVIRDDFTIEGYEVIELLCDLIAERASLIKSERECPYDMREAVCTLIWAASRVEIPELVEVKKQLTKKYGQDFAASAMRNVDGCVNERVMLKLSVQPPSAYLVMSYMKEIAKQYNVKWEPDESSLVDPLAPAPAPTGKTVQVSGVSGPDFAAIYAASPPPGKIPSALPNVPNAAPNASFDVNNLPTALPATSPAVPPPSGQVPPPVVDLGSNSDSIPDFDELSARFERLRRKQEGNQSFTF